MVAAAAVGSLGTASYDPDLHIAIYDATSGDLLVPIWIYLNETEDIIDDIKAR